MYNNLRDKLEGKVEERYEIIRNFRYGRELNVYKAYKVNNDKSRIPYVIKSYKTREAFEIESQMLETLKDVKNVMQMIDVYPQQTIIVCECALYDLETFLSHQDYSQRHKEEGDIIKDIVSGLLELQKHNIVHTELAPKNVMYFQEKDGYTERWKLIDFDSACIADRDCVKIVTNYSAPEIIRAYKNGTEIKANFAMDMFSFGLVLYFLEKGQHYWDGESEVAKEEMISTKHLLIDVHDPSACFIIKELLSKTILSRMTLQKFMQSSYYTRESENNNAYGTILGDQILEEPANFVNNEYVEYDSDYLCGTNDVEFRLYQQKTFKTFLENYHHEMKKSLEIMGSKIDNCTKAVEGLTTKIPQWLVKVKNEKVPRVFVMVPDKKDWKKPASWISSKPFRLLFVCEHKGQWHIPEQTGYKVLQVPQFIKKYGPWISLCLTALFGTMGIMAPNMFHIFPSSIVKILSAVFNHDNPNFMQHIQEIIDTIDIGGKTIADEHPKFNPLNKEHDIPYQTINATGLRELKKFLDTHESEDRFGGLVQCIEEETGEILWLCENHRDGYRARQTESEAPSSSREYSPRDSSNQYQKNIILPQKISTSIPPVSSSPVEPVFISPKIPLPVSPVSSVETTSVSPRIPLPTSPDFPVSPVETIFVSPVTSLPTSPVFPVSPVSPIETKFTKHDEFHTNDIKKINDVDPYQKLDYVCKILFEVIDNAHASGRRHFRNDDIREIAKKMRGHVNSFKLLCPTWNDDIQKNKFMSILENQEHLYIHFLRAIVRYCIVKDDFSVVSFKKQMSFLCADVFEINNIIKAGRLLNEYLSKLIEALELTGHDLHRNSVIQTELDNFANEPDLKVNVGENLSIVNERILSKMYHISSQVCSIDPTEIDEEFFKTTIRSLNNKTVAGTLNKQ